ncbi:MAG: DUF933 domain-containing protein [Planctomycetota bacterium]|jgi:GTP-binding protein YchF
MRIALVGPPQSGKSTLFAAVAEAGGSHVDLSRADQSHLAVVKVPDDRPAWLAKVFGSPKIGLAELEFLDVPGLDLSSEAGRTRAKAHWPAMRQSGMIAYVVRAFDSDAVAPYRGRVDPMADVDELRSEMLFADLDQVTSRIDKLDQAVRKPTPNRAQQQHELDLMRRFAEALEQERTVADVSISDADAKLVRSFAFLSALPDLVVINCGEDQLAEGDNEPGVLRLSAQIEEEIAQLSPDERQEFLADLGVTASARDRLIHACYERLDLVSFLTAGETESRAWTVPAGTDALTAAEGIHSDMARGFIRAETVAYDDLRAAGDMKTARAAGKVRLEGKNYIVQDGDVITFRFNV